MLFFFCLNSKSQELSIGSDLDFHPLGCGFNQPDNIRGEFLLDLDMPSGLFNVINRPAIDVGAHHADHKRDTFVILEINGV